MLLYVKHLNIRITTRYTDFLQIVIQMMEILTLKIVRMLLFSHGIPPVPKKILFTIQLTINRKRKKVKFF